MSTDSVIVDSVQQCVDYNAFLKTIKIASPTCVYDQTERGLLGFITSKKIFEVTYTIVPTGIVIHYDAKKWEAPAREGFKFTETTTRSGMLSTVKEDLPNILSHYSMMQYIHHGIRKPLHKQSCRFLLRHWYIDRCEMKPQDNPEDGWVFEWYGAPKPEQ